MNERVYAAVHIVACCLITGRLKMQKLPGPIREPHYV
jgi:hypothetical protein